MENKEVYYTRVLLISELEDGDLKHLPLNNARMICNDGDDLYISEIPLVHDSQGSSIRFSIVFLFDELPDEYQEKYIDKTVILPLTKKDTVMLYDEGFKGVFKRKKTRTNKREEK